MCRGLLVCKDNNSDMPIYKKREETGLAGLFPFYFPLKVQYILSHHNELPVYHILTARQFPYLLASIECPHLAEHASHRIDR